MIMSNLDDLMRDSYHSVEQEEKKAQQVEEKIKAIPGAVIFAKSEVFMASSPFARSFLLIAIPLFFKKRPLNFAINNFPQG